MSEVLCTLFPKSLTRCVRLLSTRAGVSALDRCPHWYCTCFYQNGTILSPFTCHPRINTVLGV